MECNDTEYKRRYGEAKWNEECKKAVLAGKPFSLEKNKKNQLCLGYLARGEIEIRPICSIDEVGP